MKNKNSLILRTLIITLPVVGILVGAGWFIYGNSIGANAQDTETSPETAPNLKVAFVGDFDRNDNTRAVLQLIKDQDAEFLVGLGDLDYEFRPEAWFNMLNSILGEDFPFVSAIGNHDDSQWENFYKPLFRDRYENTPELSCSGEIGITESCVYKGLFVALSGPGVEREESETFIVDAFSQNNSIWRVCAWHHNQNEMQMGTKRDEAGWLSYETCRLEGAIIGTGHEHSYSRTRTLIDMEHQVLDTVFAEPDVLRVSEGATFAFVSGMGGESTRNQDRCLPAEPPYGCDGVWGSIYTDDQDATYGALFITFNVDDDPRKAMGEFINIEGEVIDRFEVFSQVNE